MPLRRKLLIANALLLLSLLAMAGLSLQGLRRQQEHLQASFREYAALQLVESATVKLIAAKPKLTGRDLADRAAVKNAVLPELRTGLEDLRHYKALLGMYDRLLPAEITQADQARAKELTKSAAARMAELVAVLESPDFDPADAGARADALAGDLTGLMKACN